MKKFLETDHPLFRPLWVRILIVTVCFGWAVLEFATGTPFWGILFGGLGAYAVWGFFFDFDPDRASADTTPAATIDPPAAARDSTEDSSKPGSGGDSGGSH